LNRTDKATLVDELHGKFAKAKLAVATDYCGLKVPVFQELRRELKKNESEIKVAKNTLLRFAVKSTDYDLLNAHFEGTTAVTISYGDPISPAKILVDYSKKYPELIIRGAVLDGRLLSANDLIALSKLPSKEILLSKLLSVMQAVPTNFVRVLAGVPTKFIYLLQALKNKRDQADN